MGGDIFSSRSGFLKSGQIVTGQTSLIYKGKDGTGRVITPDSYITRSEIGDIGAMNDELVLYGKNMISTALTDRDITTSSTATFEQMADNIRRVGTIKLSDYGGYLASTEVHAPMFYAGYLGVPTSALAGTTSTMMRWTQGRGLTSRWDSFEREDPSCNMFSNIELLGYTKICNKNVKDNYGNQLLVVIYEPDYYNGVYNIYKMTLPGGTTEHRTNLPFTPKNVPYTIIEGQSNGYDHVIWFE